MRFFAPLLAITLIPAFSFCQSSSTQVIKGQVIDETSRSPVSLATVSVVGFNNIATTTDSLGNFRLQNVPLGRQSIQVSFMGYETQLLTEILVTQGKEVMLNIAMVEKMRQLDEVVVKATGRKTSIHEMTTVSNRTFNPDDTRKFAGSLGDPSRMIAGFAGIASGNDSRNDIIVRGNSPSGILWQMEGLDIPNPNHYGSLSSTGGPVSMLNNNNLGKSEFFTSAFPAQYGNGLSGVFDLRLRNGNSDKQERVAEMSFTGFELGLEGPFSRTSKASYLFNYRYSTVGVLSSLGMDVGVGTAVPKYQDLNFKIFVPLTAKSKLSIWGMGGPSKINFLGNDVDTASTTDAYGDENENLRTSYFKAMGGITYETNFSSKTYGKLSLGYSQATEKVETDSISNPHRDAYASEYHRYSTGRLAAAYNLSHKFDAKNSINAGANIALIKFDLLNTDLMPDGSVKNVNIDQDDQTELIQGYVQWKHRFTEKLTLNTGLHYQTLLLNNTSALEPRFGLKYTVSRRHTLSLGYGLHSQMQNPLVYFCQAQQSQGATYTNRELDFTQSHHFVAGYTAALGNSISLKTEIYYQHIRNVPVEKTSSGFSMLNEGAGFEMMDKTNLVNNGTGKNYGVELTLEKTFSKGWYLLWSASIFDSKYKGSDKLERNTAFNSRYVTNILAGKEFLIRNKNTLTLNAKLVSMGGRYASPIDLIASQTSNNTVYDETIAPFSLRQKSYFRADFKAGYRINYKTTTLEFGFDLQNLSGNKNVYLQKYNRRTNRLATEYQQGFLPVPYLRFTF
jgi:hypothetical protein